MDIFDLSFWQQFWASLGATFMGAVIGIPVALWINGYQERKTEGQKKIKVLSLLKGELLENQQTLESFAKVQKPGGISTVYFMLKDELWKSLSDSGDIQWLKDPFLVGKLSEAFASVRVVRDIADRIFQIVVFPNNISEEGMISLYGSLNITVGLCFDCTNEALEIINSIPYKPKLKMVDYKKNKPFPPDLTANELEKY